ncbi:MAG: hypothetical protein KF900_02825 [Bacteroidetes bacterium]|nr:hypothetical protein [Bacteroidota bacterium]
MKQVILLSALLFSVKVQSQTLPNINGTTLEGKEISLPIKNGKSSVIAIVYSRAAEDELKTWLNPLYNNFVNTSAGSKATFDVSQSYDVNFVFVPMISGFKKISDEFKAGTEKEFWKYIMDTERSDMRAVQKEMKITDSKIPYIYVVDKTGKITETQSGKFTKDKMSKIEDALDKDEE